MVNDLLNRYDPEKDLPSLEGKVILVTGGTAGIGLASVQLLAKHRPEHIYFTGRNIKPAQALIDEVEGLSNTKLTFIECDFQSLKTIKQGLLKFIHDRLDVLICCAGIMAKPPGLSADGYEVQFAVNHLAHALIIKLLLPKLIHAASAPRADVRIISVTSKGFRIHKDYGIDFANLDKVQDSLGGPWLRYGQSKLANVVYARELARRYPNITTVSIHPGVVGTGLVSSTRLRDRVLINVSQLGNILTPEEGSLNQLWLAVGMQKKDILNGAFYLPIGVESNSMLTEVSKREKLASDLWEWTEKALQKY